MSDENKIFDVASLKETFMLENVPSEAVALLHALVSNAANFNYRESIQGDTEELDWCSEDPINTDAFVNFVHRVGKKLLEEDGYARQMRWIHDDLELHNNE